MLSSSDSRIVLCATTLACLAASRALAQPAIYNLGTLGGPSSAGYSINANRQVVGDTSLTPTSTGLRAFRYDGVPGAGGIMRDLGTLEGPNGRESLSMAINAGGQVAGYSTTLQTGPTHAFRYDGTPGSGGIMRDLGSLGGSGFSYGHGINASGQVAGYSDVASNTQHAFRYDGTPGAGGVMRDLGTLGGTFSEALAINDNGFCTGAATTATDPMAHAFRYQGTPGAGGVMLDLGRGIGRAINAGGQVAGSMADGTTLMAFRYDGTPGAGGIKHPLGTLGGWSSQAFGINSAGHVTGFSEISQSSSVGRAFLFVGTPGAGGTMHNLDSWLDSVNPVQGARWRLNVAWGINDAGWITGQGAYNDGLGGPEVARAFLLDASSLIPAPGTFGVLLCGLITAGRRPVRRSP